MSGGSFEYLCLKDAEQLYGDPGQQDQIEAMMEALVEVGADDVAEHSAELLSRIRADLHEVEATLKVLQPVWQAMEWWHSGDWSEERLHEAIAAYRASVA